jgi:hypothetical protein
LFGEASCSSLLDAGIGILATAELWPGLLSSSLSFKTIGDFWDPSAGLRDLVAVWPCLLLSPCWDVGGGFRSSIRQFEFFFFFFFFFFFLFFLFLLLCERMGT